MTTLVSVASVVAAAPAVLSSSPHPDAKLLALWQKFIVAHEATTTVSKRHATQHAEYEARSVPVPETCRPWPGDEEALGECFGKGMRNDGCFNGVQIDFLRAWEEWDWKMITEQEDEDRITIARVRVKRDIARRDEILRAYDRWKAADEALRRELGADRWDEETDEVSDAQCKIENEIMATPARTLDGLRVKAAAALAFDGTSLEAILRDGRPEAPEDGFSLEDVAAQLAWDILDMFEAFRSAADVGRAA